MHTLGRKTLNRCWDCCISTLSNSQPPVHSTVQECLHTRSHSQTTTRNLSVRLPTLDHHAHLKTPSVTLSCDLHDASQAATAAPRTHQRPTDTTTTTHPSLAVPLSIHSLPPLQQCSRRVSVVCPLPLCTPQPLPAMSSPASTCASASHSTHWTQVKQLGSRAIVTCSQPAAHSLCLPLPAPHRPPARLLATAQALRSLPPAFVVHPAAV